MCPDVKKHSRKRAGCISRPHEKGETPRRLAWHIMCFVSFALAAAEAQPSITWTPLCEPGSGGRLTSMAVSPHDSMHVLLGGDMLGIGVSFDRGDSWQATFGLLNWEIADFTFHPSRSNVVWAATMGGPYISRDGGVTWECRRDGMPDMAGYHYSEPLQKILFDPSNEQRLLGFCGSHRHFHEDNANSEFGAVWESTDGGESWRYLTTLGGDRYHGGNIMNACFAGTSSDTLWAAVYGDGVYLSVNGGTDWHERNSGFPFANPAWVESHPHDSRIAWVAMDNRLDEGASERLHGMICKTTNAGESWTETSTGLPDIVTGADPNRTARYEIVRVAPTDPDLLFTSNTSWPQAGLFFSRDGGMSWSETAETFEKAYVAGPSMEFACFDPANEDVVFAGNSSYVLRTIDGGATWTDATSFRPPGETNWRGRGYSGLVAKDFAFHHDDPSIAAFTAMDHGNFWMSVDSLYTWKWGGEGFPNFGGGSEVSFSGTGTIFVTLGQSSSFSGIARSRDAGQSWDILTGNGLPAKGAADGKATDVHVEPDDSANVLAVAGGTLYRSEDCGHSWSPLFTAASVNCMDVSPGNDPVVCLATDNGLYRGSISDGFSKVGGGPAEPGFCVISPHNPATVYVTSWRKDDGGVWRCDGAEWVRLSTDTFARALAVHPSDSSILVYTTDDHPYHDSSFASGVYLSTDYGESWTAENEGLACLRGTVIVFNPHDPSQLVFGSGGRGFFLGTLAGHPVGAVESSPARRTRTFPPTSPATYDILGRRQAASIEPAGVRVVGGSTGKRIVRGVVEKLF